MKRLLLYLFLLFQFSFSFAQKQPSDTTLLIVGTFNLKNNLARNIHVNLFLDEQRVDSCTVTGNGVFGFALKRNLIYAIEISKEGFKKKTVGVSTKLPDGIAGKPYFKFVFQVPLEKESEEDKDVKHIFEFPTAIVYYNDAIGEFDYGLDENRFKKDKKK